MDLLQLSESKEEMEEEKYTGKSEENIRIPLTEGLVIGGMLVDVAIEMPKKRSYVRENDVKNPEKSVRLMNEKKKL